MTADDALNRAHEHIFSIGLGDAAAELSLLNMAYGLAKLHHVQQSLGDPPDATFIASPDVTVTRNEARWHAGYGYGGKLAWGEGDRPYVFVDVKPNACGMLVGGLDELPPIPDLARRLHDLLTEPAELDGVTLEWDLGAGNHFIDLMAVEPVLGDLQLPPYVFVLHFSGSELRGENPLGIGLYWDHSPELARRCRTVHTPWGPARFVEGDDADEYLDFFKLAEDFIRRRRLLAAERLFDDFEVICNLHHQGLVHRNAVLLGCQDTSGGGLMPTMLRASTPGYLFRGLPNLADEQIDILGWRERAERHGILPRLRGANLLPHGAGYMLPTISRVLDVVQLDGKRYYRMEAEGGVELLIGSPRDLTYAFRGRRVILKATECRLGEIAARLQPLHVLKA